MSILEVPGVSGRAMIEALIAGQRNPKMLAELARGRLRVKHAALVQALTGRFDDHHAELARMLLDQVDALSDHINQLTSKIEETMPRSPLPSHSPRARPAALLHPSKLASTPLTGCLAALTPSIPKPESSLPPPYGGGPPG
jgi:transposase